MLEFSTNPAVPHDASWKTKSKNQNPAQVVYSLGIDHEKIVVQRLSSRNPRSIVSFRNFSPAA
jgi:hypothetical protein